MEKWNKYHFTVNPFMEASHLEPELNDDRLNGKIFSTAGMKGSHQELLELIELEKQICYVRSDDQSLGTGKSALMAAVYWEMKEDPQKSKKYLPIWVSVHDFRTINQLMGRVVETFVFSGVTDILNKKLGQATYGNVDALLAEKKKQRLPGEVSSLQLILSMPRDRLAWKYMNIRRTYPTIGSVELFTDFMLMLSSIDDRRILVFIDQFEEYVDYQTGQKLVQLGRDIKDLRRCMSECGNLTFVVTLHPTTQRKFEQASAGIMATYGDVMQNAATVEKLVPRYLVEIARLYISHFRTKNFPNNLSREYPFQERVITYVATNSKNNPRIMIRILGNLLEEAKLAGTEEITMDFVRQPKVHMRSGLGPLAPVS